MQRSRAETFCLHTINPDLEVDLSRQLADEAARTQAALRDAGCTPIARVRAARGVMDLVFFTVYGARLLVRCSTKRSPTADVDALTTIHRQRTFDHVVLLTAEGCSRDVPPSVLSYSELPSKVSALAELQPGWAI